MFVLPLVPAPSPEQIAQGLAQLPGLCWLDGGTSHREGRFSFVGAAPVERVRVPLSAPAPLAALRQLEPAADTLDAAAIDTDSALTPAQVPRWVGYVAYDAHFGGGCAQRLSRPPERPALSFARYAALFAFDHAHGRAFVVGDDRAACEWLLARASQPSPRSACARVSALEVPPAEQHRRAIARALEHIAAGDVYQVNLARCFGAAFEGSELALFAALRAASPVPLGFYFDDGGVDSRLADSGLAGGGRVLLARTMERFLRWERGSGRLLTRPIKGTIARSGARDAAEAAALRADPKELAEHAMIVDLMRNDLGRVAEVGSVRVSEVMAVEPYAGLSHLVSTVECRTRPDAGLSQVLAAAFPPGSVTGTPKLRAIEIIEALEAEPRDAYTGAVGFVDRAGGLSLAVAIRSAIVEAGRLRYFAGGGIVEASDPEREIAETELKARVLFDALAALGAAPARDFALSSTAVLR